MLCLVVSFTNGDQILVRLVPWFAGRVVAVMHMQLSIVLTWYLAMPSIALKNAQAFLLPANVSKGFFGYAWVWHNNSIAALGIMPEISRDRLCI